MTAPEQHRPTVYACAAGAVLHAHAGGALEPAVLLYTFLPVGLGDWDEAAAGRVDVHSDGPGSATVTVRVLVQSQSLTWQLPLAPVVAALPGQPGDEGRMVLLGVVDGEPEPGFWAAPVDCERLAVELQLPVADLVDALRGRLTPWLADDLDVLLHDDAHDHAADQSPAQTLASAVLAHYRGDLAAEQATTRLVRALELTSREFQVELGGRLSDALAAAVELAGSAAVAQVLSATGPFESEVLRLLTELPPALSAVGPGESSQVAAQLLLAGQDHDESLRAAVSVIGRLARTAYGPDLPDDRLLPLLGMVDDAALGRLAQLWVELAAAATGTGQDDEAVASRLGNRVHEEGPPAGTWLRQTVTVLLDACRQAGSRAAERLASQVAAAERFLAAPQPAGQAPSASGAAGALLSCLLMARALRARAAYGPGSWLTLPAPVAAHAVGAAYVDGLAREVAVDLLAELVDAEVQPADLIDAFVCVTAQLLAGSEGEESPESRALQVAEVLAAVPAAVRGPRWLLLTCLREAPEHDPAAADLSALLRGEPAVDPDRQAGRAGRAGLLSAGLVCVEALVATFGPAADLDRADVLGVVLPGALAEHELLRVVGG